MWGEAWGGAPWGAMVDQGSTVAPASTVSTVVVGVLVGRSPSPSLEGQVEALAVVGEAPSVWLPIMRVGG